MKRVRTTIGALAAAAIGTLAPATAVLGGVLARAAQAAPTASAGAPAYPLPSTVAITANATSVAAASAMVHGVADPAARATWFFQYGTSSKYSQRTQVEPLAGGLNVLAVTLRNLRPATTYHFRLEVVQPASASQHHRVDFGADRTFRTLPAPPGTTTLAGSRLRVAGAVVAIPLRCAGAAGTSCSGRIALSTSGGRVACGSGGFDFAAVQTRTVRFSVGSRCSGLLDAAPGHRLAATLQASFSSAQKAPPGRVTLIGS